MKKIVCCFIISIREFIINIRTFIITILVCILVGAVNISVFSLLRVLPEEYNESIKNTSSGTITVNDVDYSELEVFKSLPINFNRIAIHSPRESIGIPTEADSIEIDDVHVPNGGMIVYIQPDMASNCESSIVNKNIISGSEITEELCKKNAVWICEYWAGELNIKCGDVMPFTVLADEGTKTIDCEVAGIYKTDYLTNEYYFSMNSYIESCGKEPESFSVDIQFNDIKDYNKIVSELKSHYFGVQSDKEVIKSMMMFISALYAMSFFLIILEAGVIYALSHDFFRRRIKSFALYNTLGMSSRSIFLVITLIMQTVVSVSFLISHAIAPLMNKYLIKCLEELFEEMTFKVTVISSYTLAIFITISVFVWLLCIFNNRTYRSMKLSELLRRGEESV